jgi:hypothetical protein
VKLIDGLLANMPEVGISVIIVVSVMVMFQVMILNGGDSSVMC